MLLVFIIIVIIIIVNNNNAMRRKEKYLNLIKEMSRNYRCVKFVNLSMSSLGVFSNECSMFLDMMNDIGIDKKQQPYIIKKMITIAIRATYYISCFRTRNWDSPDLMQFDVFSFPFFSFFFFFFLLCFVFVFVFVFFWNNSISNSICKLPICSEIYNCAFKNTNKVSIIIIIIILLFFFINAYPKMAFGRDRLSFFSSREPLGPLGKQSNPYNSLVSLTHLKLSLTLFLFIEQLSCFMLCGR